MANETELRLLVADTNLPTGERKDAASLLIRLLASQIAEPNDNDAEVVRLRQPWPRTTDLEIWLADSWSTATQGRSLHGYSLKDAKLAALGKRVRERLQVIAHDATEHPFVKEAALARMQGVS